MEPSQILELVLEQLDKTFVTMMSSEWDVAMMGQPEGVRHDALKKLEGVQDARLRLRKVQLAEIAEKLKANERALEDGTQGLAQALKDLGKIKEILEVIGEFLKIIATIIQIAGSL